MIELLGYLIPASMSYLSIGVIATAIFGNEQDGYDARLLYQWPAVVATVLFGVIVVWAMNDVVEN